MGRGDIYSHYLIQGWLDAVYHCGHTGCATWAQKLAAISTGPSIQATMSLSAVAKHLINLNAWFPPLYLSKYYYTNLIKHSLYLHYQYFVTASLMDCLKSLELEVAAISCFKLLMHMKTLEYHLNWTNQSFK